MTVMPPIQADRIVVRINSLIWLPLLVSMGIEAASQCEDIDHNSYRGQVNIKPANSGYEVFGEGRLYFYSAPDDQCISKNIYMVRGDQVDAYAEYNNYLFVIYFTKVGHEVSGWVKKNRLKSTHQGVGLENNGN